MNLDDSELLLRFIDGKASSEERRRAMELLRTDRAARDFMREVAEQSVMVADLERTALGRQQELSPRAAESQRVVVPVRFRRWPWLAAAAALMALLAVAAIQFLPAKQREVARVSKVTGSTEFVGSRGEAGHALTVGSRLRAGDTLETCSIDAWIELELRDGSKMTVAGHSALRVLEEESGALRLHLLHGSLWVSPAAKSAAKPLVIQTPSAALAATSAQFDLHACSTETTMRVNEGSARVKQNVDGNVANVTAGNQVVTSLNRREPLAASPQPKPINSWACDLGMVPEITLGRWLPPSATERARLGTEPLLWPIPNRDPLLLHVAALSVLRSSDRPVLLQAGAKLVFRGRTERPQMVRFGFSTQKMRGAFAGKFEIDVQPESLGPTGQTWTVTLPLSDFRPLQPHLSPSPDGLELNDVYALTIIEDAGLELNHIKLVPAK